MHWCVLQDFFVDEVQSAVSAGTADDGAADLVVFDCFANSIVPATCRSSALLRSVRTVLERSTGRSRLLALNGLAARNQAKAVVGEFRTITAPLNMTLEAGPLPRGQGAGGRGQEGGPLASEWRAVSASESTDSQWTLWHWKG